MVRRTPSSRALCATSLAIATTLCVACSDLTEVDATDVLQPDQLANAAGAEVQRVGAIGTFAVAYGSNFDNSQVVASGLIADEFYSAGGANTSTAAADLRALAEPSGGPYVALQRSRIASLGAVEALQQFAPTPKSKTGQVFALLGYAEVLLAESVCSGIALGSVDGDTPRYGSPLSTSQVLDRAIADFDSALVYAADSARILNLARVGRARALLDRDRAADAAAAVALVPTSYSYAIEYAVSVQPNYVWQSTVSARLLTVSDVEGTNGLNFRSANDPRVPTATVGKGFDGVTDVYHFTKYSSAASPIVLASGIEARLIEAEASLRAGNPVGALATLNALRATQITPALAPLTLQTTPGAQVDQLFRERAFWLFATGHRQGDLRRLIRQYGRAPESVFPTGLNRPGTPYGTDVTFTPDATATVNPAYTACANRGA